ncbi:MAG: glycosyltransferase family 39 protein [Planctomycetaceae bacterium]|jgi:4-amino-4-deoxy-L-arabinose transferase-like glycosyltransferase|nr:glycosyltransferase family 39 protein [Planctomycetaceae bacterium]
MQDNDLRNYGILFFIAIVLYLPNLGGTVLWDVDEAEFASCAAESLRCNDWIVPQLNGKVYGEKPILLFWFMMICYQVFGISEFAARFPSVFFAIGSLFLTYQFGSLFFNRKVGFWAAIALSASLMFSIEARAATPDSPLTFFVVLSLYVWAYGTFRKNEKAEPALQLRTEDRYYPKEIWRIVAIYLVMGVGVLMKGPLACVIPTAIIGMFLLIKRLPSLSPNMSDAPKPLLRKVGRFFYLVLRPFSPIHFLKTVWFMRPFTALLTIAVVALPWYLLVGWKTGWFTPGGYLYNFIYVNNFQRATTPFDGRVQFFYNPLFFYPVSILIGFFPWSIFSIPAVWESVKQYRANTAWNDGLLFLFCWSLVWVGCFSVAATKLPSYIVPMYPAFALLIGIYIRNWIDEKILIASGWNKIAFNIGIFVGIAMLALGTFIVAYLISTGEIFIPILLGLIMLIGCVSCLISLKSKPSVVTLVCFTLTAMFFTGFLHIVGLDRISTYHPAREIGAAIHERQMETSDTIRVVSFRCFRQSWVYYAGRPFERVSGTAEELATLLNQDRPEIVLVPASLAEGIPVPQGYRQKEFRDFRLPKRPRLIMFVQE